MAAGSTSMCTCTKCRRTMQANQFYSYKDGTKMDICKKCLTMRVDPFDEETFLWIIEKLDLPWIPLEWQSLRDKYYAQDPHKAGGGTAIFGRYCAAMKLQQYRKFGWADSDEAQIFYNRGQNTPTPSGPIDEEYEHNLKARYDAGEISKEEYKTLANPYVVGIVFPEEHQPEGATDPATSFFYNENEYMKAEDMPDPTADLTQDDKVYLAMKWGRLYKPSEWVQLEQFYKEMMDSFDIQDADTIETLKFICKVNLKMNQAIDCGDVDGFQKLSRTYDSLRKSAKFTAAQNKDQKSDYVDSVGELVAMCEKQGFIPRYATDIPQDKVDATLKDMNDYLYKLVTQDLGFGHQIEDALKKIQYQKEMDEAESELQKSGETYEELDDLDLEDYYEEIESQKAQDMADEEGGE